MDKYRDGQNFCAETLKRRRFDCGTSNVRTSFPTHLGCGKASELGKDARVGSFDFQISWIMVKFRQFRILYVKLRRQGSIAYPHLISKCCRNYKKNSQGTTKSQEHPGVLNTVVSYLLLTLQTWVWFPTYPKKLKENLLMLLRLFNRAAKREVDSGLKMLIEPI